MKKYRYKVSPTHHGMKLLAFLREKCTEASSVKALKRAVDGKQCQINRRVEFFSTHQLSQGDLVELILREEKKEKTAPTALFEDEDIIILNKPPHTVSSPNDLGLAYDLVHRIDKDTSGVLVLAKNADAKEAMEQLFLKRKISKFYLAVVDGVIKNEEGSINHFLVKKWEYEGAVIYGKGKKGDGQNALTYWKCLKKGNTSSLLFVEPITGRTHQIRAHLKNIGHPILGDWQYSKDFTCSFHPQRQMLHAYSIEFVHPTTKKFLKVIAPVPQDILECMKTLQLSTSLE